MKWLNYHHVIYFREIARLGSIAKASVSLKVGQPALSAQLKTLEDSLGVLLFERKGRKLLLTDAGKVALDYANRIEEIGQELLEVVHEKTFSQKIHLRLGAIDIIPKHLIIDIIEYVRERKNFFVSIFEGNPHTLMNELLNYQLDVLIADQDLNVYFEGNIFSKKMMQKRVHAYAHPKYLKKKSTIENYLKNVPVILPILQSKLRSDLEQYFHQNNFIVNKIAETQDTILQKMMALKGDGIIFLPSLAAEEFVEEGKLVKLFTLKNVMVEYFIIYSRKDIQNPVLDLILERKFS